MRARIFAIGALAAACELAFAQDDPKALLALAQAAYDAKDHSRSAELYAAAIKAGAKAPDVAYNAGCCCALLERRDEAFRYLALAIENGFRNAEHMQKDEDLRGLHEDARWDPLLAQCRAQLEKYLKSIANPALREELLARVAEDQAARLATPPDWEAMQKIDAKNTARMKEVVEQFGWPGKSLVGEDGAMAAFLMVQHAADREFQRRCLDLMKAACEKNEARRQELAYLTDRVLLAEGQKQLYGTQFLTMSGETRLQPIEDEANVDARRKEMGLGPLAEYVKLMKAREQR